MSNMRIVYDNSANRVTAITASTTAGSLAVESLLTDVKSQVWRSLQSNATLTLEWSTGQAVSMVGMPFCNFSSGALMRVRGYTDAVDAAPVFDTGLRAAAPPAPFESLNWGSEPLGVNAYAYGSASYATLWFAKSTVKKLVIDLDDSGNIQGYLEASRLVVGAHWEVTNNVEHGSVDVSIVEGSTHIRTDAGDLYTDRGTLHKTMSVSLSLMPNADRNTLWRIMRGNGLTTPVYMSVTPEVVDGEEEQMFQIYGKLSRQASIKYQFVNQYTSQLEIEEI
jgi:hypothetical protein